MDSRRLALSIIDSSLIPSTKVETLDLRDRLDKNALGKGHSILKAQSTAKRGQKVSKWPHVIYQGNSRSFIEHLLMVHGIQMADAMVLSNCTARKITGTEMYALLCGRLSIPAIMKRPCVVTEEYVSMVASTTRTEAEDDFTATKSCFQETFRNDATSTSKSEKSPVITDSTVNDHSQGKGTQTSKVVDPGELGVDIPEVEGVDNPEFMAANQTDSGDRAEANAEFKHTPEPAFSSFQTAMGAVRYTN
ncbi:uncharacterized protein BDZ99DRAFT_476118 [Mytilinidion resinicola]|uniref:Uncharacterized protein n=1 Tax=Mytilinidion resinicola TaxID=574789 RepID=A0A6A6YPD2_9PEZI|nr:uncharacterized protein BDZ99DRAFT_476118 [Mytilinidion resinicola]KAF2809874.1 hypothetical protein BDZ99DRAFT_476118 [Mytilinidion resinicola]